MRKRERGEESEWVCVYVARIQVVKYVFTSLQNVDNRDFKSNISMKSWYKIPFLNVLVLF